MKLYLVNLVVSKNFKSYRKFFLHYDALVNQLTLEKSDIQAKFYKTHFQLEFTFITI